MLTILIPTKNRYDFVLRLLEYYAGLPYKIIIGDSSDTDWLKYLIKMYKSVEYIYCPELDYSACMQELIKMVKTRYVVLNPDDDFITIKGIKKAIDFLENDIENEYSAVTGKAISIRIKDDKARGKIVAKGPYKQRKIVGDTACKRISEFYDNYFVTLFAVHRTEYFRKMHTMPGIKDKALLGEIFPCTMSVVLGKIKKLRCKYLIRQVHSFHTKVVRGLGWITSEEWNPSHRIFIDLMAKEIADIDCICEKEAKKVVVNSFKKYFNKCLLR